MRIKVNAADFEERQPVEPAIYNATIALPIFHAAKGPGKFPYHEVTFKFEDKEGKPQALTRNFSHSPKAASFIARLAKAADLAPDEGEDLDLEFDDLQDVEVKISVIHRQWTDSGGVDHLGNEISKVLPA